MIFIKVILKRYSSDFSQFSRWLNTHSLVMILLHTLTYAAKYACDGKDLYGPAFHRYCEIIDR